MQRRDDATRRPDERPPEGTTRRLRVLVSAFACKPGGVSEEAVGWNLIRELARRHDLWVLTNAKYEDSIRAAVREDGDLRATFSYISTTPLGKTGMLGFNADYYLWQARATLVARALVRRVRFDVAHHLTYGRYWTPSALSLLPIPYLLGPVGGGESTPAGFLPTLDRGARRFETIRSFARWLGEADPWVRRTARNSRIALAATSATAERLRAIGAPDVRVCSPLGLSSSSLELLGAMRSAHTSFRAISVGRMLPWKGFDLGIRAFAQADLPGAEMWLIGDGPHLPTLKTLARELGVADRITFFGRLERLETLEKIASCHVLVHPSLHEAAGFVCLEAMAAGLPVIALTSGGPGRLIELGGGVGVTPASPTAACAEIASALVTFANDSNAYREASDDARRYAQTRTWSRRAEVFDNLYRTIARTPS